MRAVNIGCEEKETVVVEPVEEPVPRVRPDADPERELKPVTVPETVGAEQ